MTPMPQKKQNAKTMKSYDQGSSLFWFGVSCYVCRESLQLGVGTLRNPGMGLMAFGGSILLGVFSLALFLQATTKKKTSNASPTEAPTLWHKVILVLVALLIYAKVMPLVGYLISTFLLMGFLFWIFKKGKIGWVVISSLLSTVLSYMIFSKWLNCQFPQGIFGF
jgi:hypothetical protein